LLQLFNMTAETPTFYLFDKSDSLA